MNELATIVIEELDGVVVARVIGEIDASNAARVQDQFLQPVGHDVRGLIVDLTETGYVDSAGIRVLFDTGERLKVRGMGLRLVAAPDSFTADVLRTVRMADRFPVDETVRVAVAGLASSPPAE